MTKIEYLGAFGNIDPYVFMYKDRVIGWSICIKGNKGGAFVVHHNSREDENFVEYNPSPGDQCNNCFIPFCVSHKNAYFYMRDGTGFANFEEGYKSTDARYRYYLENFGETSDLINLMMQSWNDLMGIIISKDDVPIEGAKLPIHEKFKTDKLKYLVFSMCRKNCYCMEPPLEVAKMIYQFDTMKNLEENAKLYRNNKPQIAYNYWR